jgi:hypothetical protein
MSGIMAMLLGGVSAAVDEFFNRVTLLLPGNGTNGAQNNTFLDSSTNNFTITRNGGNPGMTQGTFSPFSQTGWSNFFDGTDDYLSVADNAVLRPGAGTFTLEAWIWRNASGAAHTIYAKGGASTGIVFQVTSTNVLRFTHTTTNIDSTGTISANAWTHVAVVREGTGTNQTKLYINGTQDGQGTVSTDFTQTEEVRIGTNRGATEDFNGYISNLRFTKGAALYTGNFTPSTSPLTTTSQGASATDVELLTCQSNRFVDNSSNGFSITSVGTPSAQAFEPFAPEVAYSAATVGGSGYFDGTGDYLSLPTSNSTLLLGSGDFSVEAFFYMTTRNALNTIYSYGTGSGNFRLFIESTKLTIWNGSTTLFTYTFTFPTNSWFHLVVTRASGTLRIFIDGVLRANGANSTNFNAGTLQIGADAGGNLYTGYLSSSRIVVGGIPSAYSTSSTTNGTQIFTPPTAPFTGSESLTAGSVVLLANYTNAGITDATAKNDLETLGNAQISTAQSKFGGSSMLFDGTGDYLSIPTTNQSLTFGSANWTIEFWLYLPSLPSTRKELLYLNGNTSGYAAVALHICSNNKLGLSFSESGSAWKTDDTTGVGNALSATTWQYIAVTRNGQNIQIYVDGAAQGSAYTTTAATTSLMTTYTLNQVGAYNSASFQLNAYIDDLRITRGEVRTVTSSPTAAFPLQ